MCRRYANNEEDALDILRWLHQSVSASKNTSRAPPLVSWIKRVMIQPPSTINRRESRRRSFDIEDAKNLATGTKPMPRLWSQPKKSSICCSIWARAYRSVFNLYVIEGYSHKRIGRHSPNNRKYFPVQSGQGRNRIERVAKRFRMESFPHTDINKPGDEGIKRFLTSFFGWAFPITIGVSNTRLGCVFWDPQNSEALKTLILIKPSKDKVARHQDPYNGRHWQCFVKVGKSLPAKDIFHPSLELLPLPLGWQTCQSSLNEIPVHYAAPRRCLTNEACWQMKPR